MDIQSEPFDPIMERIGDHFDYLDRKYGRDTPHDLPIMNMSILDRDLYFVHDLVAITLNAGMAAWIH